MMLLLVACFILYGALASGESIDEIIANAAETSLAFDFIQDEDTVLIDLDMIFNASVWKQIQQENSQSGSRGKRKAIHFESSRWTNKIVPYTFEPGAFSSSDMKQIRAAINDWERYTCLDFKPRSDEINQIYFRDGRGCSSAVGMNKGRQNINLSRGCRKRGIIVHEIGHAIGFVHEQSRPDRDDYVEIMFDNVRSGHEHNFYKFSNKMIDTYSVPYDYRSIMHYGKYYFTKNKEITIRTIDERKQDVIGRREGLSFKDIQLANLMYECSSHCGSKQCPDNGFLNKDCKCVCPGSPVRECDNGIGCEDKNVHCESWAARGECVANPNYMLPYCRKSCNNCNNERLGVCEDANDNCEARAARGDCVATPGYMLPFCRKSCDNCDGSKKVPKCIDKNVHCESWAARGECEANPNYMLPYCRKSCNNCNDERKGECEDANTHCKSWADRGECKANPNYMLPYCRKSCGNCLQGDEPVSVCEDSRDYCQQWKDAGYCSNFFFQHYMANNCQKSCDKCP